MKVGYLKSENEGFTRLDINKAVAKRSTGKG